ncbi:Hypothetical predicted protein, partial [Pelobates cultripes]
MNMVQSLNQKESPIKFTSNISSTAVQFLDLEIAITDQGLSYCLYKKPTDRNTILHSTSAHPEALKKFLPKAQFLRVIRNNSDKNVMEEQLEGMMERFLERGYRRNDLVRALEEAKIANSPRVKDGAPRLVFPVTYHDASPEVTRIIKDNWKMLACDDTLPKVFKEPPLICYRRNTNLRDLLVHTDPSKSYEKSIETHSRGSIRCLGCVTCGHMTPSRTFQHPHSNKIFQIR